jgi:hypothetical protein
LLTRKDLGDNRCVQRNPVGYGVLLRDITETFPRDHNRKHRNVS